MSEFLSWTTNPMDLRHVREIDPREADSSPPSLVGARAQVRPAMSGAHLAPRPSCTNSLVTGGSIDERASVELLERGWALSILIELANGARRFQHLRNAVSGLSGNLLARRLRELEDAGLVKKTRLPAPAEVCVYELASAGVPLRIPLRDIQQWAAELSYCAAARSARIAQQETLL